MAARSKKKKEEKTKTSRPKPVVEEVEEKEETPGSASSPEETPKTSTKEVGVEEKASEPEVKEAPAPEVSESKSVTPAPEKPYSPPEEKEEVKEIVTEPADDKEGISEEHSPIKGGKEDEPEGEIEEVSPKKGNFKIIFFTALVTTIIVASLAGGVYVFLTGTSAISKVGKINEEETLVVATSTPAPTATAEPEDELDLTQYSVSVLNGSGTAGAAGAAKTLLETAGFEIETTGNADTFDFINTIVQAKKGVALAAVDAAVAALEDDYSVETGDELESTASADIIISVGTK